MGRTVIRIIILIVIDIINMTMIMIMLIIIMYVASGALYFILNSNTTKILIEFEMD